MKNPIKIVAILCKACNRILFSQTSGAMVQCMCTNESFIDDSFEWDKNFPKRKPSWYTRYGGIDITKLVHGYLYFQPILCKKKKLTK